MSKDRSVNRFETEETLRHQLDGITRLAEGLVHRVKNSLSTIQMRMGLLTEELEKESEPLSQKRILKKILTVQQESKHLQQILDDFLCLTDTQHLELTNADINKEVERTLRLFKPEADEKHVEIHTLITSDLPTVRLNRDAFHQAVINILRNAIQAMKEDGGKLVVRTRDLSKYVALDVIDYGSGMDAKTISRIFEPFYSTKKDGSGLGLPIVQQIIFGHGGHIAISSELGSQTQFTITLPIPTRIPDFPPPSVVILPKD